MPLSKIIQDSIDSTSTGVCRAWVNFNGTGTVAIQASLNVSSITDNGTGDYTVNFTNAMPDANYVWSGSSAKGTASGDYYRGLTQRGVLSAGSVRLHCGDFQLDNQSDSQQVSVAVFR